MLETRPNSIRKPIALALLALTLASSVSAYGDKKKKDAADTAKAPAQKVQIDTSKLVWPSPPSIPRVKYMSYYAGEKIDYSAPANAKKKASWMDRLAGSQPQSNEEKLKNFPFQLLGP